MNPDPWSEQAKKKAAGRDRDTEDALDRALEVESLDDYENSVIEAAKTGEWFEQANPFARDVAEPAVLIMPDGAVVEMGADLAEEQSQKAARPDGQAGTSKKVSGQQTQQTGAGQRTSTQKARQVRTGQADKAATSARIDEAIERTDAFLDYLEGKYGDFGGDAQEIREIREKAGQSDGSKSDKDAKGGGKVTPKRQKLTDEERKKLRPYGIKISKKVKMLPPSEAERVLEDLRDAVRILRKHGVTLDDQKEIIDLYNESEAIREQVNKEANKSRREEEEFSRVFGDI